MAEAYIGLGSNQGNRHQNLQDAIRALDERVQVLDLSAIYRTKAWGLEDQPDFFNQVLKVKTKMTPEDLLEVTQGIERGLGRQREIRWGPRTIDLDLLIYGELIKHCESLRIPHPGIPDRNFVLTGMMDLAPNLKHPVLGKTIRELYLQCLDTLDVLLIEF